MGPVKALRGGRTLIGNARNLPIISGSDHSPCLSCNTCCKRPWLAPRDSGLVRLPPGCQIAQASFPPDRSVAHGRWPGRALVGSPHSFQTLAHTWARADESVEAPATVT